MLGAAVIVFRETLEAALIIGILAAATAGTPHRAKWLSGGVAAGILGAVMLALGAEQIGEVADGIGQELMNAGILGIAVAMLAWHNIWMSRHGAQLAREAKQLGRDVKSGATDMASVAVVVAMAVLREGSETVLFLYGLIAGSETTVASTLAGTALGIGAGAFAGVALYAGFVRIPARWFFSATSALILLLAAAMAGQMARFLVQAGLLPSLATPLWDSSALLPTQSPVGAVLHVLVGYEATPSGMQVTFYSAVLVAILLGMRWAQRLPVSPRPSS